MLHIALASCLAFYRSNCGTWRKYRYSAKPLTHTSRVGSPFRLWKEHYIQTFIGKLISLVPLGHESDFACSFCCNSICCISCEESFQAVSFMSPMTLEIASPVAAFHRSHSEGGGCVTSLISRNQLWSCQKCVIKISSLPHFTRLPKTSCIMFGEERHISDLLAIPPKVFFSERSALKYQGTLKDLLLSIKLTT